MDNYENLIKSLRWCADNTLCIDLSTGEQCPRFKYREICKQKQQMHEAADTIEELVSRLPKWISVKDERPSPIHPSDPDYRPYLIIADGDIYLADYSYDKYFETCYSFYVDGEEMTGVTHWMKLPEPPKGE